MGSLKTVLVALAVVASLYAATGTAWARSESGNRGTAWTDLGGEVWPSDPVTLELDGLPF